MKGIIGLPHSVNFDVIYAEKLPDLKSWLKYGTQGEECPSGSIRVAWALGGVL